MRPAVCYRDIDVAFENRTILTGINLDVRRGEFLCIVGPSGCGKTTLLRLAAGLLQPTRGNVSHDDTPILGPRQDFAVVFQDYGDALLPWRTAAGNISLIYETQKVPQAQRTQRIEEMLARVGLREHADKYPNQLSGGMQQRLQIARCLAQQPVVWLMDEPFGALDAITRQTLQDEILRIVADSGATVLFITHDLEEAIYLGDRVIAMKPHPGRIAATYAVELPRPRNQRTTPEDPEFLRLRRSLFDFINEAQAG